MATQSRPLMNKGVALASAAAIAAATPAIMPTLDVPTHALATAEVQLATFADVMSVPPGVWSDVLFANTDGWGGKLSSGTYGPAWAAPQTEFAQPGYVNPWADFCKNECFETGISGVAYLFFDALINGDGTGYDNSENWPIGIVNYLLEPIAAFAIGGGSSPFIQITNPGFSAATWYALQGTIGQAFPELTVPIAALFWGPNNLSVAYNAALLVVAAGLSAVPLIGPFLGNSVIAYLGDLQIPGTVQPDELYYQFGLSGTLNYWIDIASGAAPFPTPPPPVPPAAAAAPVEAATALVSAALKSDVTDITPAAAPEASPAVEVAEATPVAGAPESVATEADAPTAPAVDLPAAEVAGVAAVKAPKRPVRSAVERAAKSVQSALGATKADTASSDAVSPGGSVGSGGSVGPVGSGSTAAESASDAGSAGGDAGSASSEAGSADSAG